MHCKQRPGAEVDSLTLGQSKSAVWVKSTSAPTAHKLTGSTIAAQAVAMIAKLYEVEREAAALDSQARWLLRQQRSRPAADALHAWLTEQRQKLANADATAKASTIR